MTKFCNFKTAPYGLAAEIYWGNMQRECAFALYL